MKTTHETKQERTNDSITRKFQVRYQLGGRGSEHVKLSAAIRAMAKAERAARRGGDIQGVYIEVNEYRNGAYYGPGALTDSEALMILHGDVIRS